MKKSKSKPNTKIVRVNLSALTRAEWSALVEIPADAPEDRIDELADRFYDGIDGSEFTPDPEFWEKGDGCYVSRDPELGRDRVEYRVDRKGRITRIDPREVTVQLKIQVPARIPDSSVPALIDMLIGAGLSDAEASTELAEEERHQDTDDALSLVVCHAALAKETP